MVPSRLPTPLTTQILSYTMSSLHEKEYQPGDNYVIIADESESARRVNVLTDICPRNSYIE